MNVYYNIYTLRQNYKAFIIYLEKEILMDNII